MNEKTCFVTGANGFVGINLCIQLLQDNWKVYALIREDADPRHLANSDVTLVRGSVTDLPSLEKAMPENLDAVFHLAGITSQYYKDYPRQTKVNIEGTQNMLKVAENKNVKRFIHVSSIMAFGLHQESITEESPSNADRIGNNYAFTKLRSEEEVILAAQNNLDAVVVNPSHIMGPYDRNSFIQLFEAVKEDALPGVPPGSGMFCHVDDVCSSLLAAYEKGQRGEKYLVGGNYLTFEEVAREIQKQLGKKKKIKVIPQWVFQMILPFYTIQGWLTGKEPLLTKWKVRITGAHIKCDDTKAVQTFGLKYKSLQQMVSDTLSWRYPAETTRE